MLRKGVRPTKDPSFSWLTVIRSLETCRWCNSSLDCISYWLKIGANSSSSVLLRNYWLWLASLKIITLCVHCYLWTWSHIPTLTECIEQHSRAIWWLRCYIVHGAERYWALLHCSISWWLNTHTPPLRGAENPPAFQKGEKWAIHHPLVPTGAQPCIQTFPVSVITTQLFFDRSHEPTQHHSCCTLGRSKTLICLSTWGSGDEFHFGFNT